MLEDRGMKKWTSMMLPEHAARLQDWANEYRREQPPNRLTEWQLADIQVVVDTAFRQNSPISFRIFESEKYRTITGTIQKIDVHQQMIFVETTMGIQKINFFTVQGAEFDD